MSVEKYYVKNESTGLLERLMPPIDVGGGEMRIHALPEQWAAHGAYPANYALPVAPAGKKIVVTGWDVEHGKWIRRYRLEDLPPPSLEDFDAAMEAHLKSERDARGYTTREPDSYLTSQVPRWAADARDWVAHRDAVMEYALALINAVEAGERQPPTMEEFVEGLPRIVWTYTEGAEGAEESGESEE